jgi:hypothetical protein
MNYATERLFAAAKASLAAWEDEEQSVRQEHAALIDELENAIHYFNYHGAKAEPQLHATLERAHSFISGFQGDEMQEGIDELLADLQTAIDAQPEPQP